MAEPARRDGLLARARGRVRVVVALLSYLRESGLWWLVPLVITLLTLGLLLGAIAGTGPLAPFIYPLL